MGWQYFLEKKMATYSGILAWGKSHGHRSLVGYSPWGHEELDTTEQAHFSYMQPSISSSKYLCIQRLLTD